MTTAAQELGRHIASGGAVGARQSTQDLGGDDREAGDGRPEGPGARRPSVAAPAYAGQRASRSAQRSKNFWLPT